MATETRSSGSSYTAMQRKIAGDALYIFQGACNGLAAARTLIHAYESFGPDTDSRNQCAPVRLILVQLCHLAQMDIDMELFELQECLEECEKIAGFKLVEGRRVPLEEVSPERIDAAVDAQGAADGAATAP